MALPREEPFGMTPLEGLASAVPFVASDTGYYRQFSDAGGTGVIVPVGDADGAAQAADALLSDPARLATLARRAREVACTRFAVRQEAEAAVRVYERLWRQG
jgi:mannosyltransferase